MCIISLNILYLKNGVNCTLHYVFLRAVSCIFDGLCPKDVQNCSCYILKDIVLQVQYFMLVIISHIGSSRSEFHVSRIYSMSGASQFLVF